MRPDGMDDHEPCHEPAYTVIVQVEDGKKAVVRIVRVVAEPQLLKEITGLLKKLRWKDHQK